MIVAIASEGGEVARHFGRCPEYTLFEIEGASVTGKRVIPNPGHEPGFLPRYLAGMGVKCMIAGGMGHRAQSLFAETGIDTYVGVEGKVNEVINEFVAGSLQSGISTCDHTGGGHNCG